MEALLAAAEARIKSLEEQLKALVEHVEGLLGVKVKMPPALEPVAASASTETSLSGATPLAPSPSVDAAQADAVAGATDQRGG